MIPYSKQLIEQDDIEAVTKALTSSHLTQGKEVEAFEKEVAEYLGVKFAVAFNSGTSALHAAYIAAGIKAEDEVITSPISFVATSNMFVTLGAKPVWCDVKLDGNMDERFLKRLITPKTKAIVPIDFSGKPVEIEAIAKIAKEHNLLLIEDACHAFGSSIDGVKVGNFADMTIFSTHAIKPFTTAEGGVVVTNNEEYYKKLKRICSHGIEKKQLWNYDMVQMGYNYRLTEIQAALGRNQLKKVDSFIKRRAEIATYYHEIFSKTNLFDTIKLQPNQHSSWHLFPIILRPELHCPKEDIFKELQAKGLGVQVHYKPIYKQSFYQAISKDAYCPVAEDFYKSEISIPCHQGMNDEEVEFVAQTVLEVVGAYSYRGCSF